MKKLAIVVATLFVLAGCGSTQEQPSEAAGAASPEVAAAIKEAEEAIKKSASIGGQWRDAGKMLKKAKAAAAKGDNKTALKQAKMAKFEGDMGYEQAKGQEKAGPWLF